MKFGLGYKEEKGSSSRLISPSDSTSQIAKEVSVSPISSTILKEPEILKKKHIRPKSASKLPRRSSFYYTNSNNFFLGHCFYCNLYGHRISTCKFLAPISPPKVKLSNSFEVLSYKKECYTYGELGHISANCHKKYADVPPSMRYAQNQGAFSYYNCGQPGHLARNCRSNNLNSIILKAL